MASRAGGVLLWLRCRACGSIDRRTAPAPRQLRPRSPGRRAGRSRRFFRCSVFRSRFFERTSPGPTSYPEIPGCGFGCGGIRDGRKLVHGSKEFRRVAVYPALAAREGRLLPRGRTAAAGGGPERADRHPDSLAAKLLARGFDARPWQSRAIRRLSPRPVALRPERSEAHCAVKRTFTAPADPQSFATGALLAGGTRLAQTVVVSR